MNDDPAIAVLELIDEIDTSAAVPLPAGGISFHHTCTLRCAGPLSRDGDRWARDPV